MVEFGYSLSSEEHGPRDLVRFAGMAEEAGFTTAWVSDHYHPWVHEQGQSPFVWCVLGGIAQVTERMRVGTGVTCPTIRTHPAIIAQAAATAAEMLEGRFFFGVGSGENLNEHVLGDPWPEPDVRLEMLEEAVAIIRKLWAGDNVSYRGRYYRVEDARLYTLPAALPPIMVSAFGPKAVTVAARIGDGYVGTSPDPELVQEFRRQGGQGKPCLGGLKVCWGPDEHEAAKLTHRLWPNMGLPGQLSQELRTVAHFEQAVELVTMEHVPGPVPVGPDPERHVASLRQYLDAGYDQLYIHQIGPNQEGFLRFYSNEVLPQIREG
jgi:G6PDH family F420-dependent oxidoreductase